MNGSNHCLQLISNKQLEWNHDMLWKSETDNKETWGQEPEGKEPCVYFLPVATLSAPVCSLLPFWVECLYSVCVSVCVVCVAEYLGFWFHGFFFGNRVSWNPQCQHQSPTHLVAGDVLELLVYLPYFPSAEIPALDLVHPLIFSPSFFFSG